MFVRNSPSDTSGKFYQFLFQSIPIDDALNGIWKSKCLLKLKVVAWLLLTDSLNTKEMMLRNNWKIEDGPLCVLCNTTSIETRDHLFFDCPFAANCWSKVRIQWDCSLSIGDRFYSAKHSFS
jgi:hypothetical protein